MVLDHRWAAADSGPGQSTLTLSPPEIAAEVYDISLLLIYRPRKDERLS